MKTSDPTGLTSPISALSFVLFTAMSCVVSLRLTGNFYQIIGFTSLPKEHNRNSIDYVSLTVSWWYGSFVAQINRRIVFFFFVVLRKYFYLFFTQMSSLSSKSTIISVTAMVSLLRAKAIFSVLGRKRGIFIINNKTIKAVLWLSILFL